MASMACTAPLLAGFGLPAWLLVKMAFRQGDAELGTRYIELVRNSLVLAAATAACAVALALLLAYAERLAHSRGPALLNRLVGLGYALPGSVIAVGVLIPVTRLDQWLVKLITPSSATRPACCSPVALLRWCTPIWCAI